MICIPRRLSQGLAQDLKGHRVKPRNQSAGQQSCLESDVRRRLHLITLTSKGELDCMLLVFYSKMALKLSLKLQRSLALRPRLCIEVPATHVLTLILSVVLRPP